MANNYIHYRHVGVTGGLMTFTLSDAASPNGKSLAGWTAPLIIAKHPGSDAIKFQQAFTPDPDQTANPGKGTYQPISTDVDTVGEFPLFFRVTDPNGRPWEFPTDDPTSDQAFGTLIVY
jgi:hypothetical protein